LVLGRDFSGAVAALGAGVDDLKNVDAVFGVLEVGREGGLRREACSSAARRSPAELA
jgi:NADPH:quinone reductase-like Zn-dependent oxidoreductase